ncbi:MAG: hypothetical protein ACQJCO_05325 [cyanobacterium endosymbiont of Rhopalodia sterrenbergii]
MCKLLQTDDIQEDVILQGEDLIMIPRTKNISPEEAETIRAARFYPSVISLI